MAHGGPDAPEPFISDIGDRAVGTNFNIILAPILHLGTRIVKALEPVHVRTFHPELAVERLDECVVRRHAGPAEVQRYAFLVSPQIQIPRDELGALIHPDRLRITMSDIWPR